MSAIAAWLLALVVLGLIGWGMFTLTRHAVRVAGVPARRRLELAVAVPPALAYGLLILRVMLEVRLDPGTFGLWPMLVVVLLLVWASYILLIRVVALVSARLRRAGGASASAGG